MKIWNVLFTGIYPVGRAAITCTRDDEGEAVAVAQFRELWSLTHPHANPEPVTVELLCVSPGTVHILCDGNY